MRKFKIDRTKNRMKDNKMILTIMGLCAIVLLVMVLVGAVVKHITTPQTIYTEAELTKTLQSADTIQVTGEWKSDTKYRSVFVEKEKLANIREVGLFDYQWEVQNDGNTYITMKPDQKKSGRYELSSKEEGNLGYLVKEEGEIQKLIFQDAEGEPVAQAELTELFGGAKTEYTIQSMENEELYRITSSCNDRTNVVEYTIQAKNKNMLSVWNVFGLLFLCDNTVTGSR